jgi:25S rRNA (uracil2634-N3)-methyltransferase
MNNNLSSNNNETLTTNTKRLKPAVTTTTETNNNATIIHHLTTRCNIEPPIPLFVLKSTMSCALNKCISCLHKICSQYVENDLPSTKYHANTRPETCPRFYFDCNNNNSETTTTTTFSHCGIIPKCIEVSRKSKILTIGDGDLSFSRSLVEFDMEITATSFHTEDELKQLYSYDFINDTIKIFRNKGFEIQYQVDATNLHETLNKKKKLEDAKFDIIIFNFPAVLTNVKGTDAQLNEIEENRNLLRKFSMEATLLLDNSNSFIIVTHKTIASFGKEWNVVESMCESGHLQCVGAVVFDKCAYPGYRPRKALDNKGFPVTDAVQYIFVQVMTTTPNSSLNNTNNNPIQNIVPVSILPVIEPVTSSVMKICVDALLL